MKIRHSTGSGSDKVEVPMTPMIDIVFQLLVFFIMTFKIVVQEGDFNVKMPLGAPREGSLDENLVPPMKLYLTGSAQDAYQSLPDPDGNMQRALVRRGTLSSVALNENNYSVSYKAVKEDFDANRDGVLQDNEKGMWVAVTDWRRTFGPLNLFIINYIGDERGPGSVQETAEVEINADYNLRYEHTVEAITAVSGYTEGEKVEKLVEKIKFAPPTEAPAAG